MSDLITKTDDQLVQEFSNLSDDESYKKTITKIASKTLVVLAGRGLSPTDYAVNIAIARKDKPAKMLFITVTLTPNLSQMATLPLVRIQQASDDHDGEPTFEFIYPDTATPAAPAV